MGALGTNAQASRERADSADIKGFGEPFVRLLMRKKWQN